MRRIILIGIFAVILFGWMPSLAVASTVYPVVTGYTSGTAAGATSQTILVPSGSGAALFFACFAVDSSATATWPSGWQEIYKVTSGGVIGHCGYTQSVSTLTSDSITIALSLAGGGFTFTAYRIVGADGFDFGTASGNDASPNPPSLSASSYGNRLWIAAYQYLVQTNSAYPSGYGIANIAKTGNFIGSAMAARDITAITENPGTATISGSNVWVAVTISVRPSGSGANPGPGDAVKGGCYGDTNGGSAACDYDVSTEWASASGTGQHFLIFNLTQGYIIKGVRIDWGSSDTSRLANIQVLEFFPNDPDVVSWLTAYIGNASDPVPNGQSTYSFDYPHTTSSIRILTWTDGASKVLAVNEANALVVGVYDSAGSLNVAAVSANPTTGNVSSNLIYFSAFALGGYGLITYTWTFGDGFSSAGLTGNVSHAYISAGTFQVMLLVNDSGFPKHYANGPIFSITITQDCFPGCATNLTITAPSGLGIQFPGYPVAMIMLGLVWLIAAAWGTAIRSGFFIILGGLAALGFAILYAVTVGNEVISSTLIFALALMTLAWAALMAYRERTPEGTTA